MGSPYAAAAAAAAAESDIERVGLGDKPGCDGGGEEDIIALLLLLFRRPMERPPPPTNESLSAGGIDDAEFCRWKKDADPEDMWLDMLA